MEPDDFPHLDRLGRGTAAVVVRSRAVVYGAMLAAVALSWAVLLGMAASQAALRGPSASPGDALIGGFPGLAIPSPLVRLAELCLSPASAGDSGTAAWFAALVAMWMLMSVAMMLPSAAPMLRTFCEIADTAAAKGEASASPLVLVAGYLTVWLGASVLFAGLTVALGMSGGGAAELRIAAAALALAGLYQFSGLKEACLKKCRNPFAVLFGRWSPKPARIFRLGLEQGAWCVGCCWALMLVMFAVGVMNVFWMALIGLLALVEKQVDGRAVPRAAGTILLVWAAALLVSSLG